MLRLLYSKEESSRYPLDKRLRGYQSRSGCFGEDINLLHLPETRPRSLGLLACSLVVIPAEYGTLLMLTNVTSYVRFELKIP
jgi:hypothetical protein